MILASILEGQLSSPEWSMSNHTVKTGLSHGNRGGRGRDVSVRGSLMPVKACEKKKKQQNYMPGINQFCPNKNGNVKNIILSAQWSNLPTETGLVNTSRVNSSWSLHVEHPNLWERQKGGWWQDAPALLHNCICNLNLFNWRRELKSQASCSLLLCSETPRLSFWTVTSSPVEILL